MRWTESDWRGEATHYACAWCGKGYLSQRDIEEHQRAHHPDELAALGAEREAGAEHTDEEE